MLFCLAGNLAAAGELRTLQLYHVHTGESLTITYTRDGQYSPSAMAQLDYFLRDWRRSGLISMSAETRAYSIAETTSPRRSPTTDLRTSSTP